MQQIQIDYTDDETGEPIAREDIIFEYIFLFSTSILNQKIKF
jgi:hypothetical protein